MTSRFKYFFKNEHGAVAVDWFVISAALVGLATATIIAIQGATVSLADDTSGTVINIPVGVQAEATQPEE